MAEPDAPSGGPQDLLLLRFDAAGQLAWSYSYGDGDHQSASGIAELPDGTIVIAGRVPHEKHWLMALDSSGAPRWQKEVGPVSGNSWNPGPVVTTAGDLVAASAGTLVPGGPQETRVRSFAADGSPLWDTVLSGGADLRISLGIAPTSDGGAVVSGATVVRPDPVSGDVGAWFVRLDASGQVLWETVVDSPEGEWAHGVQQTADGGFVGSGVAVNLAGQQGGFVAKLDAFGSIEWTTILTAPGDQLSGVGARETSSGRFIVTGAVGDFVNATSDALLAQLDVSGNLAWARAIGGSGTDSLGAWEDVGGGHVGWGSTNSFGAGGFDAWMLELDSGGGVGGDCELTRNVTLAVERNTLTRAVAPTTVRHPIGAPTPAMSLVGGPHGPLTYDQQCDSDVASEVTTVAPWLTIDSKPRPKPWQR